MSSGFGEFEGVLGPPARPSSMSQFAHDKLRGAIVDGTLKGGTRLVIASLAQTLGVSSTPLREALRDLANEGLVVLDARRGAEVVTIDFEEAAGVYEIRAAIEPLLMRRTVRRIAPEELAELEEIQSATVDERDLLQWIRLHSRFHEAIAEAAHWDTLENFSRSLYAKTAIYVGLDVGFDPTSRNQEFWRTEFARAGDEHAKILDAVREGDEDAAAALMGDHITATLDSLRNLRAVSSE